MGRISSKRTSVLPIHRPQREPLTDRLYFIGTLKLNIVITKFISKDRTLHECHNLPNNPEEENRRKNLHTVAAIA